MQRACPFQDAECRAGSAPPGAGRQLKQTVATPAPTTAGTPAPSTAGMAGAQPPPRRGRCRGVPFGALRVLWLLPRTPWRGTQGYSRVLEGARGRRASLYGIMGGFGTNVHTTYVRALTHAHSSSRCVPCASAALRAGKYTWGAAGKNVCPVGTARIDDLTACQAAAAAAGKTSPSISENSDLSPKGCYSATTSPNVYFNAHVLGALQRISSDELLLCAGAGVCARFTHPPVPPTASPHVHCG
jgi:hypothetical protein